MRSVRYIALAVFVFATASVGIVPSARAEPAGIAQYVEQLGKERKPPSLDDVVQVKSGGRVLDIRLFVGDALDPLRRSFWSIDGYILSTNIQLNFGSPNPNIQAALRKALPARARTEIEKSFAAQKPSNKDYGDGFSIPALTTISSQPVHLCFVVTDHEEGWSFRDDFSENNLSLEKIAKGVEQCVLFLAPSVRSILMPAVGASQIRRGDNYSKIGVEWLREKHICRRQKAIRGILLGLGRAVTKLPPASRLAEVGIVIYEHDVARAIPDTKDPEKSQRQAVQGALLWAFRRGTSPLAGASFIEEAPRRSNGASLTGDDCENFRR